jgi:hypothetical protein
MVVRGGHGVVIGLGETEISLSKTVDAIPAGYL